MWKVCDLDEVREDRLDRGRGERLGDDGGWRVVRG